MSKETEVLLVIDEILEFIKVLKRENRASPATIEALSHVEDKINEIKESGEYN